MSTLTPCSWPRSKRVQRRADFVLCYEANQRYFSKHFVLFTRQQEEAGWRAGFTVSRKMGNAVRRNKMKRILREFFRQHGQKLPQGLDIIVVPKKSLINKPISYALVHDDLSPLLKKLNALGERVA